MFSIPDPIFPMPNAGSLIRIKECNYFNSKKLFLSSLKYDPGCSSRIRILIFYPSRIPDPGVKKAPDPGSGSATLNERQTTRQRYCGRLRKKENDCYNIRLSVVLRIRDILVRIRILGSVLVTNGSGSSVTFPRRQPQKKFSKIFSRFSLLLLLDDRRIRFRTSD